MRTASEHPFTPAEPLRHATSDAARDSDPPQPAEGSAGRKRGLLSRGWRKMTWVLIAWSVLVVLGGLVISGHTSNQLTSACQQSLGGDSLCQQVGSQTGAAQFDHILKLGVIGFVVLSIVWFMTRPRN